MLEIRPIQADPMTGEVPVRTGAMEDLVERMDRAAGTVRPNLAVRFAAEPDLQQPNRHGVLQHGCTFVGECVVGCNKGAKNSLDYNYLAVAEKAGAVAMTEAEWSASSPATAATPLSTRSRRRRRQASSATCTRRCPTCHRGSVEASPGTATTSR
jgi:cholesterol oxidase